MLLNVLSGMNKLFYPILSTYKILHFLLTMMFIYPFETNLFLHFKFLMQNNFLNMPTDNFKEIPNKHLLYSDIALVVY